jgi:membrane protease YdiL (CAAX protease family)
VNDRVRLVFTLVFYALVLALVIFSVLDEGLPGEILGTPTNQLFIYILVGAVLVRLGWRLVVWFRRRNYDNKLD